MQGYSAHLALPQPSVSDADAVSLLKADSISITKTTNDIACVRLHHRHSLPTVVLVDRWCTVPQRWKGRGWGWDERCWTLRSSSCKPTERNQVSHRHTLAITPVHYPDTPPDPPPTYMSTCTETYASKHAHTYKRERVKCTKQPFLFIRLFFLYLGTHHFIILLTILIFFLHCVLSTTLTHMLHFVYLQQLKLHDNYSIVKISINKRQTSTEKKSYTLYAPAGQ